MEKLIIEASINESARKEDNPHVPYGPEEGARDGIAAAKAGAAIIHYHPRDEEGQNLWHLGTEMYLECYRLIREECPDVLVYPTQRGAHEENTPHLFELARDEEEGLELATVDIFPEEGITGHDGSFVAKLLEDLRALNVSYSIGVRHTGHMRHIARFHEQGLIGDKLIMKIFWNEFSLGPPPGIDGLKMYLDLLPPGLECQWFNTVYDGLPGEPTLRRT
ncbi:MAG: 3-keto-5-aminohexanoate cleavage protein, partial [Chloroflexi bacterium]|nr:3-keto-5-aminohexanoate cleavage protein [Chloroflexota bacterium]